MSAEQHEWTVLIIGEGSPGPQLVEELERLGQDVDEADAENASTAVTVSAPDLVVLVGDAAADRGKAVLGALADGSHTAVAPVMVIGDSARAQVHPNYRHGPVAALSNKLPVPLLAKRVLDLARDVPDRSGEQTGRVSGDQLETLVGGLANDKRSGTLDVNPDDDDGGESLVMSAGQPLSESSEDFVARVQPRLDRAPGSFRFKERSGGRTDSVAPPAPAGARPDTDVGITAPPPPALRILVVDGELRRAESLAQALRDGGAIAEGIDGNIARLDGLAHSDTQVVLMAPTHLRTKCKAVVAAIESHPRLRWASTLLAPQGLLWPPDGTEANLDVLQRKLDKLTEPDSALRDQANAGRFETRLEVVGPGRMLRAIARCTEPRRVVVRHPRVKIAVTLQQGRVVQATAKATGASETIEGSAALSALFAIRSGRVEVTPARPAITLANAKPVEEALDRAARTEPAIQHSIKPPPAGAAAGVAAGNEAEPSTKIARKSTRKSAEIKAPPPIKVAPLTGEFDLEAAIDDEVVPKPPLPPPPPSIGEISDFGAPIMDREGSGVIELASGPLPLAEVLERTVGAPREDSVRFETSAEVTGVDGDGVSAEADGEVFAEASSDAPPKTALATGLAQAGAHLSTAMTAAAALTSAAAARARAGASRIDGRAVMAFATRIRALAGALPAAVRYGMFAGIAVLLIAMALWPTSESTVDASASVQGAVAQPAQPAAVPPPAAEAPPPAEVAQVQQPQVADDEAALDGEADADDAADTDDAADADDEAVDGSDAPTDEDAQRKARIARARKLQNTASRLRRQGRLGLAESKYLEALAQWPTYPLAMAGVVRLHLARKDGREAVRWAQKLVRLQPNRGNNQLLLGDAYMLRRMKAKARRAYRQSVRYGNRTARKRLAKL